MKTIYDRCNIFFSSFVSYIFFLFLFLLHLFYIKKAVCGSRHLSFTSLYYLAFAIFLHKIKLWKLCLPFFISSHFFFWKKKKPFKVLFFGDAIPLLHNSYSFTRRTNFLQFRISTIRCIFFPFISIDLEILLFFSLFSHTHTISSLVFVFLPCFLFEFLVFFSNPKPKFCSVHSHLFGIPTKLSAKSVHLTMNVTYVCLMLSVLVFNIYKITSIINNVSLFFRIRKYILISFCLYLYNRCG